MKRLLYIIMLSGLLPLKLYAQKIVIGTGSFAIVYQPDADGYLQQIYLGKKLLDTAGYRNINSSHNPAYATGGSTYLNEPALQVKHADGNMSLALVYMGCDARDESTNIKLTDIRLKDPAYPFYVTIHYRAYQTQNIIETWTSFQHAEKEDVILNRYASAFINITAPQNYLTHFYGEYNYEMQMHKFQLAPGIFSIQSKLGVRTACNYNPSFLVSPNNDVTENTGEVFAGSLAYSGNFDIQFESLKLNVDMGNSLKIIPGINAYASSYPLKPKENFETPHFIFTYTNGGEGQVSRNFHSWAINYGIGNGHQKRQTLLNNWEATYFTFNQDTLVNLFDGAKKLGVDMFLLDDGWFANKYPRDNSRAGLGDWDVNKKKLPNGIGYLVKEATAKGLNFGIWIEPEMVNPKSELYEKHPEWVLKAPNRPAHFDRSQLVLDLTNPAVQDFAFGVIDKLMGESPQISYIKWDCNRSMDNAYSPYLGKNQDAMYVRYTQGFYKVLDRVRAKYPNLEMMLCASGGGRVEYGALKYFQEFWPSDNTYPMDRIKIQWGYSYFYPALAVCAHVTAAGSESLKYKLDVAMSCKLGFDIMVKKMTERDITLSRTVTDNYKRLQNVINYGDLYRLVSPYKTNFASLMYVDSAKNKALVFAYNLESLEADTYPVIKMDGLDPNKKYKVTEINLNTGDRVAFQENGKIFSGETLMEQGLKWYLKRARTSSVLELHAI